MLFFRTYKIETATVEIAGNSAFLNVFSYPVSYLSGIFSYHGGGIQTKTADQLILRYIKKIIDMRSGTSGRSGPDIVLFDNQTTLPALLKFICQTYTGEPRTTIIVSTVSGISVVFCRNDESFARCFCLCRLFSFGIIFVSRIR